MITWNKNTTKYIMKIHNNAMFICPSLGSNLYWLDHVFLPTLGIHLGRNSQNDTGNLRHMGVNQKDQLCPPPVLVNFCMLFWIWG